VVLATEPELAVKLTLSVNVPPEVLEISYPVGAVTVRLPVRVEPETLKLASVELVP
jgi:hypothetical protein